MIRTFILAVLLAACIAAVAMLIQETANAKPPAHLAPPVPCTSKNRMDVFIDEDYIMYECQCQMLAKSTLCAWQVIGGVDAPSVRKRHRRARVVAYTIPPVLVRLHA